MKLLPTLASLLLCAALPLLAHADNAPSGCTEVTVDGYKAPDYGCLGQQMGNDTNAAKAAKKNREAQNLSGGETAAERRWAYPPRRQPACAWAIRLVRRSSRNGREPFDEIFIFAPL